MPQFRWIEPTRDAKGTELAELGLLGDVLLSRGYTSIDTATRFLDGSQEVIPDPSTLPDIKPAADRILQAIAQHQRIAIFGDYDVDGVTSAALLTRVLTSLGADVLTLLPNRDRDGYGLNMRAVKQAADADCRLLITVDCGTGNFNELQYAASRGLDAIVVDHHHVSNDHLPVVAFVSPKRNDSRHEFSDYAAVGVVYQLLRYILESRELEQYLPMVAVGTVADVVPLTGPNRAIVQQGLRRFRDVAGPGLLALARVAGLEVGPITSHHVGFMLGPRINAAGRIDDPRVAFDLLMTDSSDEAAELAVRLSNLNSVRQKLLQESVAGAKREAEFSGAVDHPVVVVQSDEWRVGLVGLIASRLSDQFNRPVVAIEERDGIGRGSARSIDEFNVVEAFDQCADLLVRYGGHSKAAGMTIETRKIGHFTERINRLFREQLGPVPPIPALQIDANLDPAMVSLDLVAELSRLEPHGNANPQPVFIIRGAPVLNVMHSRNRMHLRFKVATGTGQVLDAVSFGAGARLGELGNLRHADLAVSLRPNTWRGRTSVTLEVVDFRPATGTGSAGKSIKTARARRLFGA